MAKNIGFSHGFKPQEHDDFSFFFLNLFCCFYVLLNSINDDLLGNDPV